MRDVVVQTIQCSGQRTHADTGGARRFEEMVAPVYLRRNQRDVLRELPECIEIEEWVTLTNAEREVYFHAVGSGNVMAMRQAAIGRSVDSAKLRRLKELIDEYESEGRKMVVFSFFLQALALVGELLGEHSRIDGSVPAGQRMRVIDDFNHAKGFAAMICQITAGGEGINLQCASAVVLLEPQFKPTTEWQAIKRVHRMGQSSRVVVHRLLARETVDDSLRELVGRKAALFNNFARESAVKDASPAAVDISDAALARQLVDRELARRDAARVLSRGRGRTGGAVAYIEDSDMVWQDEFATQEPPIDNSSASQAGSGPATDRRLDFRQT